MLFRSAVVIIQMAKVLCEYMSLQFNRDAFGQNLQFSCTLMYTSKSGRSIEVSADREIMVTDLSVGLTAFEKKETLKFFVSGETDMKAVHAISCIKDFLCVHLEKFDDDIRYDDRTYLDLDSKVENVSISASISKDANDCLTYLKRLLANLI